jgi:hypothetical protein
MGQSEDTPANRKKREKEEAKVARDAEKASDVAARFAQSSLLKMEPLYLEMQALVAHSSFGQVSEIVREPINKNCIMIQSYLVACSAGGELPFDQKTLAVLMARIKKDIVLCKNMLCTIAKAAGR